VSLRFLNGGGAEVMVQVTFENFCYLLYFQFLVIYIFCHCLHYHALFNKYINDNIKIVKKFNCMKVYGTQHLTFVAAC
jgi:hypothetical protein